MSQKNKEWGETDTERGWGGKCDTDQKKKKGKKKTGKRNKKMRKREERK